MSMAIRRVLATVVGDLRYGLRGLAKSPAFTLVAAVTLGLGIGANSAMFTVVNAVLLKGLPYKDPDRLVHVWETEPNRLTRQVSFPDFVDVRDRSASLSSVAGYAFDSLVLKTAEGSERLRAARVSANFFSTLGVEPAHGRLFQASEDQPLGSRDAVLITDGLWRRRFGADPGVVGRPLILDGAPRTVVGVLPRQFQFARLGDVEVFVTLSPAREAVERRYMHWMWAIGRLRDGASLEAANAELGSIATGRALLDPQWHKETGLRVVPLRDALVGPVRPLILGLFASVAAVLLIACANVANMLLARAMGRRREVAIRLAMGAGRGRIMAQFLTESVLLFLIGGAVGLLWAGWGVRALVAAIPANLAGNLPFLKDLAIDPGVLGFTFAVCLATGLLFGLLPAFRSSAQGVADTLKDGARGASGRQRVRSGLVVTEIAIAMFLVVAAGLMGRSLTRLLDVDPGFDLASLTTASLAVPGSAYDTPEKLIAFFDRWQSRVRALPGVRGVALVDRLPLLGSGNTGTPSIAGAPGNSTAPDANLRTVSASYFEVMGLKVVAGRDFSEADGPKAARVVIVNRAFVDQVFGGRDAVGQSVGFAFVQGALEVVGVVADEQVGALDDAIRPVLYFPWRQDTGTAMSAVIRTQGDPRALMSALSGETRSIEPDAIVSGVRTMNDLVASTPAAFLRSYPLLVLGCFAVLALILASIGIYGVMSLTVGERTSEIGIRMAIGAQSGQVLRLFLKQGLGLSLLGVGLGVAAGLAGTRLLSFALFETPPNDPLVFGAASAVLVTVAALACSVPAWRASRVDPLRAVRYE